MPDQLMAVAVATRFLVGEVPGAAFRGVQAHPCSGGGWWVNFTMALPPNVVQSPGCWTVAVDAQCGAAWPEYAAL